MEYLLIKADGTVSVLDGTLDEATVGEALGGAFEALPQPTNLAVTMLANPYAKSQGLDANWKATQLMRSRLRADEFIAGPVLIAGEANGDGAVTSLAVAIRQDIMQRLEK